MCHAAAPCHETCLSMVHEPIKTPISDVHFSCSGHTHLIDVLCMFVLITAGISYQTSLALAGMLAMHQQNTLLNCKSASGTLLMQCNMSACRIVCRCPCMLTRAHTASRDSAACTASKYKHLAFCTLLFFLQLFNFWPLLATLQIYIPQNFSPSS